MDIQQQIVMQSVKFVLDEDDFTETVQEKQNNQAKSNNSFNNNFRNNNNVTPIVGTSKLSSSLLSSAYLPSSSNMLPSSYNPFLYTQWSTADLNNNYGNNSTNSLPPNVFNNINVHRITAELKNAINLNHLYKITTMNQKLLQAQNFRNQFPNGIPQNLAAAAAAIAALSTQTNTISGGGSGTAGVGFGNFATGLNANFDNKNYLKNGQYRSFTANNNNNYYSNNTYNITNNTNNNNYYNNNNIFYNNVNYVNQNNSIRSNQYEQRRALRPNQNNMLTLPLTNKNKMVEELSFCIFCKNNGETV